LAAFILNKEAAMRFSGFLLLLTLPFYFFSCKPQERMPNYLERISDSTPRKPIPAPPLRIKKNDLLSIEIHSASNDPQKSDAIYNQIPIGTSAGNTQANIAGFLVDNEGNIEHHSPEIGTIHAEGMTKQQLAAEIKQRLSVPVQYLTDPTVVIRFLNFKVNVIGEVNKEGVIDVPGERITILDAVGLAGGIKDYGLKNNVKIIRENGDNYMTGFANLTTDSIFQSPFYYLQQNDVVMVDPSPKKAKKEEQAVVQQKMTMAFTIATVVTSITQLILNSGGKK
jgi:polysaccharide export outer membrane protein